MPTSDLADAARFPAFLGLAPWAYELNALRFRGKQQPDFTWHLCRFDHVNDARSWPVGVAFAFRGRRGLRPAQEALQETTSLGLNR